MGFIDTGDKDMSEHEKIESVRWLLDKITPENTELSTRYYYRGETGQVGKLVPRLMRDDQRI